MNRNIDIIIYIVIMFINFTWVKWNNLIKFKFIVELKSFFQEGGGSLEIYFNIINIKMIIIDYTRYN